MGGLVEDEIKDGYEVLSSVTPKIGRVVLFDHRALHEGKAGLLQLTVQALRC